MGKIKLRTVLHPICFNYYDRHYYYNYVDNVRATVDFNLTYLRRYSKIEYKDFYLVLELKTDSGKDFPDYFMDFEYTRFSKYVRGMQMIYRV